MTINKTGHFLTLLAAALAASAPASLRALENLTDDRLSDETGGSGLTLQIINPTGIGTGGGSGTNLYLNPNNGAGATSATFEVEGVQVNPIGEAGATTVNPLSLTVVLDAGSDAAGPGMGLSATWTRTRLLNNRMLVLGGDMPTSATSFATPAVGATGASQYAFGRTALDGPGSLTLVTSKGLLNTTAAYDPNMRLRLTLGPSVASSVAIPSQFALYTSTAGYGQFYYQPNTAAGSQPQLVLDNMDFDAGFNTAFGGMIGACTSSSTCGLVVAGSQSNTFAAGSSGLYFVTPRLDFNLTFNFNMQAAPTTNLQTSAAVNSFLTSPQALAVWGWMGDFSGTGGSSGTAPNTGAGLLVGGGGVWSNSLTGTYNPDTPAGRQNGVNLAFHGNFDSSNFSWFVGRPGEVLAFGNWVTLPGSAWSLNAPNITLGVVNAGQGSGGLCWGASAYVGTGGSCGTYAKQMIPGTTLTINGQNIETNGTGGKSPNNPNAGTGANTALAILIRDLSLQAYSTSVIAFDDINQAGNFTGTATANSGASISKQITEPWALIYTLGQMDGNIFLYPGSTGLVSDVILQTQSFKNNSNPMLGNSNFMIGETCTAGTSCNIPAGVSWCNPNCILGVGLTQANMLFAANQLQLNLNAAAATDGAGLQLSTGDLRIQIQGIFGGGLIQNGSGTAAMAQPGANTTPSTAGQNQVVASFIDLNLQSNAARLTVSPQLTSYNGPGTLPYSYIGLAGHFTLTSPGTPNNTTNVFGTAPTASSIDIQPASCTTFTSRSCDGTYFSLAEPFQPNSDLRFANIQGDITILSCQSSATCNGATPTTPSQIFLMSAGDPGFTDAKPRLRVATNLAIGGCADGGCGSYAAGGAPLSATIKLDTTSAATIASPTLSNSPNALGTMVIPNAQIYTSITMRPQ